MHPYLSIFCPRFLSHSPIALRHTPPDVLMCTTGGSDPRVLQLRRPLLLRPFYFSAPLFSFPLIYLPLSLSILHHSPAISHHYSSLLKPHPCQGQSPFQTHICSWTDTYTHILSFVMPPKNMFSSLTGTPNPFIIIKQPEDLLVI